MKLLIVCGIIVTLALGLSEAVPSGAHSDVAKILDKLLNVEATLKDMKTEIGQLNEEIGELRTVNTRLSSAMNQLEKSGAESHRVGPTVDFTCPRENGTCIEKLYTNIFDCATYWSCSTVDDCVPFLIACPEPLEFSEVDGTCVDESVSGCTEVTTESPLLTTPEPTTEYPCPPESCYPSTKIAFLAKRAQVWTPAGDRIAMPYPVVAMNYGNAYNGNTGRFTAPVNGIYYFHFVNEHDSYNGYSYAYLLFDNLFHTRIQLREAVYALTGAASATMELAVGDTVAVSIWSGSGESISCDTDGAECQFGGFLIFAT